MPFTNKPFYGQDENRLVKSPYVVSWNDDSITPPPGANDIITEIGEFVITEAGDFCITES